MPTIIDPKAAKAALSQADDVVIAATRLAGSTHKTGKAVTQSQKAKNTAITQDEVAATAAAAALSQMNSETSATVLDKALDKTGSAIGIIGMIPFIGTGALKLLGGGVKKVGGWFKSEGVQKIGGKIQAPAHYLDETTFSQLGEKMGGVGKSLGNASQKVADVAAVGAEKLNRTTGIANWFSGRAFGKAQGHFNNFSKHASALDLQHVHSELLSDVAAVKVAGMKAQHVGHLDSEFATKFNALEKKIAELEKAGSKAATGAGKKQMDKMMSSAGNMVGKLEASRAWGNPAAAVKGAPKAFASGTIGHNVMNGSFVLGSGIEGISHLRGTGKKIAAIKEAVYDETGKRPSTFDVVIGNVPEFAKDMRSAVLKKSVVKLGADVIGLGANIRMALDKRFGFLPSMVAFMAPQLFSQAVDASIHDNVDVYVAFRRNALSKKSAGQKLTVEDYAPFIAELEPKLRKRGRVGQEFAMKVAEHYVAIQATPGQVLKDVESGKTLALVHKAMDDNAALHAHVGETGVSHADRLTGAKKDLKVMGPHSGKVVSQVVDPQAGLVRS
jgi:hypothetical protein